MYAVSYGGSGSHIETSIPLGWGCISTQMSLESWIGLGPTRDFGSGPWSRFHFHCNLSKMMSENGAGDFQYILPWITAGCVHKTQMLLFALFSYKTLKHLKCLVFCLLEAEPCWPLWFAQEHSPWDQPDCWCSFMMANCFFCIKGENNNIPKKDAR